MAKKWRRSGGGRPHGGLPPGPVLSIFAEDTLQADGVAGWLGTHYLQLQYSINGVDGWADGSIWPVDADPLFIDITGTGTLYLRGAFTIGDNVPLSQWSNVVLNP